MPEPFTITAATNSIQLDPDRRGEASFTVFNASGRPIRGRAQLRAEDPAADAWLSLEGEVEREFEIAAAQQLTVQIEAPPDAPAGIYPFRLDMVGVENPDEDYSRGPTVAFAVPEPEPEPERKPFPWWIVAAFAGVLVVGIIAAVLFWPRKTHVPRVRGFTLTEATEEIEDAKLTVAGETREAFTEAIAEGLVIGTEPPAREEVRRRTEVTLIVSAGPPRVVLPDVYSRTRADARDILMAACERDPCVEVVVQIEPSRTMDRGRVIATDPVRGTEVIQGSEVTLIVSSGQTDVDVILLEFGDRKIEVIKAVRILTNLGLRESKALVERAPTPVLEGVDINEAEEAKAMLEEAGARAVIQ